MAAVARAVLPEPVGPIRATEPRLPWRPAARSHTSSPPATVPPVKTTATRAPAQEVSPTASTRAPAATTNVSNPAPGSRGRGSAGCIADSPHSGDGDDGDRGAEQERRER